MKDLINKILFWIYYSLNKDSKLQIVPLALPENSSSDDIMVSVELMGGEELSTSKSSGFKQILVNTVREVQSKELEIKEHFFTEEKLTAYIKNTFTYALRHTGEGRACLSATDIGIPKDYLSTFGSIFVGLCEEFGIDNCTTSSNGYIHLSGEELRKAFARLAPDLEINVDEKMRMMHQTGIYR